ncbi:thrombospondin [Micromonospora sp. C51]|uniref:thrombospondin n=1 Tax=Micromonospora sp. C51 TaxID=2824879 RepID=UPI001B38ED78|nr:thrombospondin [Micromonospora sp. C51]MBQ1052557.1 thrombospondin [Micromonospora sp. C51]
MKFSSLLRREEPAPSAADDSRTGTVATDARPGERSGAEGRTDGSTTRRTAADPVAGQPATDRAATDQPATDRAGTSPTAGTDTARVDGQPDAQRSAEARAATARSTVHGSRRARAGTTETVDGHRVTGVDRTLDGDRASDRDRAVDGLHTTDRTADRTADRDRSAGTVDRDGRVDDDRTPDGATGRDVPPAPVGPRPRASLLATLGLIVGVASVLSVLTGALAGYGIALGAVGAVLAVLGLMATRRRHIAGKSDALLGIAFGLGAVVLGVLAMTGQYDWPTTDGDVVVRFREWLDSQFVDRL